MSGPINHAHAADPHAGFGLVAGPGTNIDPQIIHLAGPFTILGFHQVDGFLADHANYITRFAEQANALADQYLWVPAPNAGDVQKAVSIDVGDHEADFVDVAGQQHTPNGIGTFQHRIRAAAHIGAHLIGKALGFGAPHTGRGRFVAGWAGCIE